jgi:hypothetical protein
VFGDARVADKGEAQCAGLSNGSPIQPPVRT